MSEPEKQTDAYRYTHGLMSDEERIAFVYKCARNYIELPPSPYAMRTHRQPTQKELDDTEREFRRIKKMKEEREAEVERERLRREHILRKMKGLE